MTGVVHSDRIRQRGGVRIEYIVAAVVSVALLVAMTAVLLSVSDRKAKRELVRQPNTNAPNAQRSRPGEASSSATGPASASSTPQSPVVVTMTPSPTPAATPDKPVVVTMTPSPAPAATPDTPVVVTMTPSPTPAATPDTPVVVTMTPPSAPANTPDTPVVVTVTPQPVPANTPDVPAVVAGTPQAAPAADSGAEIAADPLDTLKIGSRPQGSNWNFSFEGGIVSVQQSPQENTRCLRLLDTNARATVWAMRKFPGQAQQVGFECRLRIGQLADGYALAILGGNKPAVLLLTRGSELGCEVGTGEWHALQRYEANVWYTIRISANVKDKTFNVYIDGQQRGEKLKFRNAVQSVEAWQVETPNRTSGTLYITAMKVTER